MKKSILAPVIALMMIGLFAACGNGGGGAAVGGAQADDEPITITVWCWDPAFNLFAMDHAARIYNRDVNPNVNVEIVEVPWGDIQILINTLGIAGVVDNLPDIILVQDMAFQINAISFPDLFYDLTDTDIDFTQFAPGKAGFSVVNGRNMGVPFDNGTAIFAVRTDIIAEAGFTVDDFTDITWRQFIDRGVEVLEATGIPMFSQGIDAPDLLTMMLQSAGGSLINPDGTANISGNAVLYQIAEYMVDLVNSGVLLNVTGWDEYIASFVMGDVAGTIQGCWILGSVQLAEGTEGNWAVTNVPRLEVPGGTNYTTNGGSSWAVMASSPNRDAAVSFLQHTFAGSVELYEIILPASGAIGAFLPAAASPVYAEPHPFFDGQPVFADIVRFADNVPPVYVGLHWYEARDLVMIELLNIIAGDNIQTALQRAHDQLTFVMG